MRRAFALLTLGAAGCFTHADTPPLAIAGAASGHSPPTFERAGACGAWEHALGTGDENALGHVSFPELDPGACFVRVHYDGDRALPDPTPPGCGYPEGPASAARLLEQAARYDAAAGPRSAAGALPVPIACALPDDVLRATARVNAATLRRLARLAGTGRSYPYAAVATFGFGYWYQGGSALVGWRPGDACPALSKREMDRFGVNILRAGRAAAAVNGHVAPAVIVSGGAVHSALTEAFLLDYLATCRFGVREDAMLLDPCADHTHTNLRNTGAIVTELGGRNAYVVTDDGLQGMYLQEWTLFELIGGSLDQRSLRDWGYVVGSWRQASVGIRGGFWFTPYRFWAEPRDGVGAFQCDE